MREKSETRYITANGRRIKILILRPETQGETEELPGVIWIHGGGYITGMAAMVKFGRGKDIAAQGGAVVLAPDYRLAPMAPYPAALEDCYAVLLYMKEHAQELGIRSNQIMVGGESAGGGLAAALCLYARDRGEVNVCYQMPLYPMLDCQDTDSSRDNHGHVWNTKRNHFGWKLYLANLDPSKPVPKYASPARETDYSNLPPAYTFVCDGEPFYCETLTYIDNLKKAGIPASVDVYHCNIHAFDVMCPWLKVSHEASDAFLRHFLDAKERYFKEQD